MKRRDFLRSSAASAGLTVLPSGMLFSQNAPSDRLNVALVGVWGRGTAHYDILKTQNVVGLCDVVETRLSEGLQVFPNAKTYTDWRRLLDQQDLEAVVIACPDHNHAFIANWALNRGKHVYCEKPLGITVNEVRTVRANYLRQRETVATQHGTQRHAYANFERVRELILDGAIGELISISGWDSRRLPRPGYPTGTGEPPSVLAWDQWLGPAPYHPYSNQYFIGGSGSNCLSWNMYRDFGVGQMGDMGAHTMDLLWNAIDVGAPTAIVPDMEVSDPFNPDVCPVQLKVTFEHPANDWHGPVTVVWYQGGIKPESPAGNVDIEGMGNGAIFEGTKGHIVSGFNDRIIIPNSGADGDMTYYRPRAVDELLPLVGSRSRVPEPQEPAAASGGGGGGGGSTYRGPREEPGPDGFPPVQLLESGLPPAVGLPNPRLEGVDDPRAIPANVISQNIFQQEWIDACKGLYDGVTNGVSYKTSCDFDYSGTMMEQMLLGLVAHRAGQRLEYDPVNGRVTNMPEANDWLTKEYREGWTLDG